MSARNRSDRFGKFNPERVFELTRSRGARRLASGEMEGILSGCLRTFCSLPHRPFLRHGCIIGVGTIEKITSMGPEIIQVIQEFSTAGGAERVAWELAQAFGRAGLPNAVVTSLAEDTVGSVTRVVIVSRWVNWFSTRGALRYLARLVVYPAFTLAATRYVRRHPESMVISHGDCLAGDVLVVHAVNAESLEDKKKSGQWRWRMNPLHAWVALRDRWMIQGLRYRRYVAVSKRVSEELQRHYRVPPSRIRVISNGIDVERFKPDAAVGRQIRQTYGIPPEARLLLFVGHEFHRKGLAYVVQAMEALDDSYYLLVVGSDNPAPYRKLAHRAADRIIYAGAHKGIERFYAAADGFVLPTSYETFSLVCMEAMACAVPVFATRVGGIEDYLRDGENGFSITQDSADIARKLNAAFNDSALLERLKAGARATANSFSWDSVASQYVDLLSEVAGEKYGVSVRFVTNSLPGSLQV